MSLSHKSTGVIDWLDQRLAFTKLMNPKKYKFPLGDGRYPNDTFLTFDHHWLFAYDVLQTRHTFSL